MTASSKRHSTRSAALSLAVLVLLSPWPARAADHRDPILVVDEGAAAVILIAPLATTQQLLWTGDPLVSPSDAIVGADGALLVADPGAGQVFRFDWAAGIDPQPFATLGASLCWLEEPGPGALLAAGPAGLVRIDVDAGTETPIPAALDTPFDLHLLAGGDVLVADAGLAELVRVDPGTGASSTFSSGVATCWIDVGVDGGVAAVGASGVYLVAAGGGDPELLASGGFLVDPSAVAFGHHGDVYVADRGSPGGGAAAAVGPSIVEVDPSTGAQTVVASAGFLVAPSAVLVLDAVPDVPGLLGASRVLLVAGLVALAVVAWRVRGAAATR